MKPQIYIPTRGRPHAQVTLANLPQHMRKHVTLVCPRAEMHEHSRWTAHGVHVLTQPSSLRNIAQKRAWIVAHAHLHGDKYIYMMDDDLSFYVWDGVRHVAASKRPDILDRKLSAHLQDLASRYKVAGLGTKAFALPGGVRDNYHLGYVFGFDTATAMKVIKWNRVNSFEDIDYTLQFLRAGVRIGLGYECTVAQRNSRIGGREGEYSVDTALADLRKLMKLHPGIIKEKQPSAQHPLSITRISWRAAAAEGGM